MTDGSSYTLLAQFEDKRKCFLFPKKRGCLERQNETKKKKMISQADMIHSVGGVPALRTHNMPRSDRPNVWTPVMKEVSSNLAYRFEEHGSTYATQAELQQRAARLQQQQQPTTATGGGPRPLQQQQKGAARTRAARGRGSSSYVSVVNDEGYYDSDEAHEGASATMAAKEERKFGSRSSSHKLGELTATGPSIANSNLSAVASPIGARTHQGALLTPPSMHRPPTLSSSPAPQHHHHDAEASSSSGRMLMPSAQLRAAPGWSVNSHPHEIPRVGPTRPEHFAREVRPDRPSSSVFHW